MKTIGMIGGMSFESTANYYKWLNETMREKLGGLASAEIVMRSLNFTPVEELQRQGEWQKIGEILAAEAVTLQKAGADFIILTSNTMHKVSDTIEQAVTIPFVHLADATAEKVVAAGIKKVGLFGTIYTMEHDFYKQRLIDKGIEVIIPEKQDREEINRVIFKELCMGQTLSSSREFFLSIANKMLGQGAEGLILGCTEVNMLIGQDDFKQPVFDTTRIHVEKAIDLALS